MYVTAADGVRLYVCDEGEGTPVLFLHEFAGDHRSWEPQIAGLRDRYRCIAFSARGYLPSEVPCGVGSYSYTAHRHDAISVLDALGVERAHIVGLSMGGFTALQLGIHRPERVQSLVVAATGSGADPAHRAEFHSEAERIAEGFLREGSAAMARRLGLGPSRVQLKNKNEECWRQFVQHLGEHSEEGSALTSLGFLRLRPSLWDIADEISHISAATLLLNGDEDEACLIPGLFLKRTIAMAALQIIPRTGHTLNLEDPDAFNRTIVGFFKTVEAGAWTPRDSRTLGRGQIEDPGGER